VGESRRKRGAGVADREGDKFDSSPVSLEGCDDGVYFLVLASSLESQPRSLQKPISTTMRVQSLVLKEVGSG